MSYVKKSGRRLRPARLNPKVRAARRHHQASHVAERLEAQINAIGAAHRHGPRYEALVAALAKQMARIEAIQSGNWPQPKPVEQPTVEESPAAELVQG